MIISQSRRQSKSIIIIKVFLRNAKNVCKMYRNRPRLTRSWTLLNWAASKWSSVNLGLLRLRYRRKQRAANDKRRYRDRSTRRNAGKRARWGRRCYGARRQAERNMIGHLRRRLFAWAWGQSSARGVRTRCPPAAPARCTSPAGRSAAASRGNRHLPALPNHNQQSVRSCTRLHLRRSPSSDRGRCIASRFE